MNWFGFVESAMLPTIIIVEIIAIAMLYKNGKKKKNKHQIYIISALCICELNNALTVIAFYGLRYGRISKTIIGICFFSHMFLQINILFYYDAIRHRPIFSILSKYEIPF